MKYRAEIDGLRALAVVPVILFHAGFELFNGGFVGVDVFFVISGYLITTILIEDIENKRFSIVNFYERRARRILPALFFVMLVCIPFAWMWMQQGQMKNFSQSLVAVSLFVSNILFWRKSGYFDAAAEENPLLHTWSIAVEEQYYVLFPIFLILAWRFGKNRVFWMIVVMAAISLLLSEWGWRNKASANFYLAPTRAWELFAGSISAFIVQKNGVKTNNPLALLGLSAIIFSIFFYDESTPFPSVYALVPVLGVVLLVLYAGKETLAAKLLSTKAFVGIGLISYSAYLWHQPLFAFARIKSWSEPSASLMIVLSIISLILAYCSWRYIEKSFRDKSMISPKVIFLLTFIGITSFATVGAVLPKIFSSRMIDIRFSDSTIETQRKTRFSAIQVICREKTWTKCNDPEIGKKNLLIIGDSHSADAVTAIVKATEQMKSDISVSSSELGGCNAMLNTQEKLPNTWPNKKECVVLNESQRYNVEFLNSYDVLIVNFLITNHWKVDDLIQYLNFLDKNFEGRILAFSGAFVFSEELPSFLNKNGTFVEIDKIISYNPYADDLKLKGHHLSKVKVLSKYDVFCPNNKCKFVSDEGVLMTYDKHHLSVYFSELLGLAYSDEIKEIISKEN